jgi:hypothetical protein
LERGFAHVLDQGGLRRTTLRGCEKLSKRQKTAALTYNLSVLLRHPFGVGTLKQAIARWSCVTIEAITRLICHWAAVFASMSRVNLFGTHFSLFVETRLRLPQQGPFSTGC